MADLVNLSEPSPNWIDWDLIVLDLDGTIADTGTDIQVLLNQALADYRLTPYDLPAVHSFIGNGSRRLVERAVAGRAEEILVNFKAPWTGEQATAFYEHFMSCYNKNTNEHTVFYDGVFEFLNNPPAKLALLTNKPEGPTKKFLENFDLNKYFHTIVDGTSGPPAKPDPTGLLQIIKAAGATPKTTMMVGDGVPDIQVAHAAGVYSTSLLQGFTPDEKLLAQKPHWTFPSFADFASAITR